MITKRIGNDIRIEWSVFMKSGEKADFNRVRTMDVFLRHSRSGKLYPQAFVAIENIIKLDFTADEQHRTGTYDLLLRYTVADVGIEGGYSTTTADSCNIFNLKDIMCDDPDDEAQISVVTIIEKGDKGDPFTFDDFTEAQIAEIKRPAIEAGEYATEQGDYAKAQGNYAKTQGNYAKGVGEDTEVISTIAEGKIEAMETLITDVTTAEGDREIAEGIRAQNETNRVSAEGDREIAEHGRASAETSRVTTENDRMIAETGRVSAEGSRESAESLRVEAELLRQSSTQEAISNAENATENANTAAQNADDARLAIQDDLALKANQVDLARLADEVSLLDAVQGAKIKDIENVISTMNPNQSAQLSVSGRKVISLPKNASNGGMSVKLEGLTAENLIANGNFANGTTGWIFGQNIGERSVADGILSFTGGGPIVSTSNNWIRRVNVTIFPKGHVLYNTVTARSFVGALFFVGVGYSSSNFSLTDQWGTYSHLGSHPDRNYPTYGAILGDTVEMTNAMCFDLTEIFGAGNEPTKEQCDLMFADYFEGVKSFEPTGRVRSVSLDGLKTSNLYINDNITLRSLPNGVKDEIRPDGKGGYELVKRVSDKVVITGNDIVSNYDSPARHTNSTAVHLRLNINNTTPTSTSPNNNNAIVKVKEVVFTPQSGWGNANATYWDAPNQYNISSILSNGYMIVQLSLSHIDTGWTVVPSLTQIKDYFNLNSITLTYQLAEPIITPIQTNGNLISYPSGTVYVENVVADAGIYSTKMDILFADYPIASLEEIIKHENGVDTYLNIASAVVTSDGLSFTHPDLTDGDLVLFTYAFDKESTNGNITASFYDSNVVKIDTATGKAYKIEDVVTDGVLTRTLTEV